MAETEKGTELLAKLAMITEAAQDAVNGKVSIVYEVNKKDFFELYSTFERNLDASKKQFKVEISGTDFIFLLDE
jgi:hypothetical protein